jgi:UPF0755 protein
MRPDEAAGPARRASGRALLPDTYTYSKGSSDVKVLQARDAGHGQAAGAGLGPAQAPQVVVKTPDEALILASIVEKETGRAADRTLISAVFQNRLRVGMPLQTDPTVIYGMGEPSTATCARSTCRPTRPGTPTLRPGLPPTPIAMPGKASLLAAVQPAPGKFLYFVAKGDGTSQFSETWTSTTAPSTSTSAAQ